MKTVSTVAPPPIGQRRLRHLAMLEPQPADHHSGGGVMSGMTSVRAALGAAALVAGIALFGCAGGSAPTAEEVVRQLYTVRRASHMTGAPTPSELTAMTPYLSAELVTLLRQARELHDAEAARSPGDKPAFAEGDLFSSLFEGPTAWEVLADSAEGTSHRLAVRFTYEAEPPPVRWIDKVVVIRERGRLVVADVRYGGDWDFGNKGALVSSLKAALSP